MTQRAWSRAVKLTAPLICLAILADCASAGYTPYSTRREKTARGAGIGAAAGAVAAVLAGKREADEILAGAAIGAAVGGGAGAYMDAQEEKLARIPGTTVERVDDRTLLVHFDSDVLFPVGSASLDEDARLRLDETAQVINEFPRTAVVVQGHTDSSGTEEANQGLSEQRANAVRGYLVRQGADPDRLVALGYGASMPVATNATAAGRAANRRVDILLRSKAA